MVKQTITVGRKPYYYYCTFTDFTYLRRFKRRFPSVRYYWVKQYNRRTRTTIYVLYTDRWIS